MRITGLILAGGRGTRMGGLDKGLQILHGRPLVLHAAQRLTPQVDTLMVNANRNLDAYRALGLTVVLDDMPDFAGPLAGLHAGLTHCKTPYLLTVPCDSPFFPDDLVMRLQHMLEAENADLTLAATGEAQRPQLHPVFCLLKVSLLPDLSRHLQDGGRNIQAWQATQRSAVVRFADETAFCNINTPDQLRKLEAT